MKVNRKVIHMLSYMVIISLIMSGCVERDKNVTTRQDKEMNREDDSMSWRTITKEYLLEHFDISEEDLEGVDIESFLSTYEIDIDKIEEYDIPELLKFFIEEDAAQGMMSYEYMLDEPADGTLTQDNVNDIVRLVWQINEGDGVEALAFDFKNEKIYEGYRIEEFDNSYLVGIPDDAIKESVIQLINEYDLYSWKDYYKGGSTEGTTASYNWQMAIEFSDGTIYRTGGDGLGDKARPDNMEDFIADLRKCIP